MNKAILTLTLAAMLTACSHIDEDERYIYMKPEQADRTVLLEDFTGQRCINCPKGTEVIEKLQAEYGDKVIAVGIHGGPLGFAGTATVKGLATDVGNEYYNHWNLEYQPVGLVDRHGAVNYTDWTAAVVEELSRPARLRLEAEATLQDNRQILITVRATGTDGHINGHLQVWMTEDNITALQMMPDGTTNREYVHNHVLRTPVNGTWGDAFTIEEGQNSTLTMEQPLSEEWDINHLSAIAFVYDDTGVLQATKARLKIED